MLHNIPFNLCFYFRPVPQIEMVLRSETTDAVTIFTSSA